MNLVLCLAPLVVAILLDVDRVEGSDAGIQCPAAGPTPPATCDGSDGVWFPVSVEGSKTFCALGPEVCVADIFAACPGPSDGLPFGSKCSQLKTNVYGCVPKTSCTDGDLDAGSKSVTCERGCSIDSSIPKQCDGSNGWTPVSVVNSSTFCTAGPVCVADTPNTCPGPQPGLPFGSSCVKIPSGVFGCVRNQQCLNACSNTTAPSTPAPTPASTMGAPAPTPAPTTTAPLTTAPATTAPATATATLTPSPTLTLTPTPTPTATPTPTPTPMATSTSTPVTTVPATTTPLVTATLPPPTTTPPQATTAPPATTPPTDSTSNPADDLTVTAAPDLVDSNTDLLPVPDPNGATTSDDLPNF